MTKKILTGIYSAGYTLSPSYSALEITATARITGRVGSHGTNGFDPGAGGTGGSGVTLAFAAPVTNGGDVVGGRGGVGGTGDGPSGAGGAGGFGIELMAGGSLDNAGGVVTGGRGGAGGVGGVGTDFGGAAGGDGGAGVALVAGGVLRNVGGAITGGGGGAGAYDYDRGGYGGDGGAGVALLAGGTIINEAGTILGGAVGLGGANSEGARSASGVRGDGVLMMAGGRVINHADAVIAGLNGVYAGATGVARVINFGTIEARGRNGVRLSGAGTITNGSAADTIAVIKGGVSLGSYTGVGAPGTIRNFGTIVGSIHGGVGTTGVSLWSGGRVINGALQDTSARIAGESGVETGVRDSSIANFGTIVGTRYVGVSLDGGRLVNGAATDTTARIQGPAGVFGAGTVVNFGTILETMSPFGVSGASGVFIDGALTNGSAGDHTALIEGRTGVLMRGYGAAGYTLTNFGDIVGHAGGAVTLYGVGCTLRAESGSKITGAVTGGGGTLELAGIVGTIGGLGGAGALTGSATMTFGHFGSYVVDAASTVTLAGTSGLLAGQDLAVEGVLIDPGELSLAAGSTLGVADGGRMQVQGVLSNAGSIVLASTGSFSTLQVLAGGVSLTGEGTLALSGVGARILGGAAGTMLTNVDDTIAGSGLIGSSQMVLLNGTSGVIEQTGAAALAIDTGSMTIGNAGTIEATGTGGLTIAGPLANSGLLEALGGALSLGGAVTGAGAAIIDAGVLDAASAFDENVAFAGTTGELVLADATAYAGAISGFSKTGGTSLDLRDIAFVDASQATFSGNVSGGVLTVTDGTHTAKIALVGNYTKSTWTASSDGAGGVLVVDPTRRTHLFAAAMASLGPITPATTATSSWESPGAPWNLARPAL